MNKYVAKQIWTSFDIVKWQKIPPLNFLLQLLSIQNDSRFITKGEIQYATHWI
jgi:hypothetical protein